MTSSEIFVTRKKWTTGFQFRFTPDESDECLKTGIKKYVSKVWAHILRNQSLTLLSPGILMKIDYVGALRAQFSGTILLAVEGFRR